MTRFVRSFAVLLALPVGASAAIAQVGTITGTVRADGAGLPGATVAVAGTQSGAITIGNGTYRIALRPGRYELRARFFGYRQVKDSVTVVAGSTVIKDFTLEKAAAALEAVAITGSRSEERTVIDAPAPIDVLSSTDLRSSGRIETAQMIQAAAPSLNFPRTTVGDGTDHVRPATLRGLGSDQVLVLINGKRRHSSALVNVNGTIGRGQAAVDLNAIPASMIDHIEILRDGAAAQYGSDAIAGVINIILKTNSPLEFTTTAGSDTPGDGRAFQMAGSYTIPLTDGFLALGAEVRDRGPTNRSLADPRPQYFPGDPRLSQPPRVNHRQGDAYTHDSEGFFNLGKTISNGAQFYAFGGYGKRRGEAAGFFRRALDDRTVRAIYPDGFLPLIESDITDASVAGGVKGDVGRWKYDLSTLYGANEFGFIIKNSENASLGASSPTRFDAGKLGFKQWTTNFDLHRAYATEIPVRLGVGAEYRMDSYKITEGEPDSYRDGGAKILDGPNKGKQPAIGAQVFPGFRPTDAGSHSRSNVAGYADLETDITKAWLVQLAGRAEQYTDFGSTVNGKLATRFQVLQGFNLRGAVSTGFRAPSLHQSFFSSTATNFIGGVPFDIRTFPVKDTVARVLGATDLKPEKSVNLSLGVALEPIKTLSVTIDYYYIGIKYRIVFSENFVGNDVKDLLASKGLTGVGGARFFTNAIDTRTEGLDAVANLGLDLTDAGFLRLTAGYNRNNNHVTRVTKTPPELSAQQEKLFGRVERARIEDGQPKDNVVLAANWSRKSLTANVRAQRFGSVVAFDPKSDGTFDNFYGAKVITDVSLEWQSPWAVRFAVGADNVGDVYPDKNIAGTDNAGIFPYSGISPFGFNGRFVYARLSWTR